MKRGRPLVWSEAVGFQWPTLGDASSHQASSPRPDQGGSVKASCRPTIVSGCWRIVVDPQSDFDRRRLATSRAFANPTTPASAVANAPVPSPYSGSADAGGSHVPAAPTRAPTSRWWSASADDDGGRSEFPLEPPSFAALWWAVARPSISLQDSEVALPIFRVSQALSRAGRCM